MTNATSSSRTVTEYLFTVPCPQPFGGDAHDLGVAMTWAKHKAEEIGLDTSSDDWVRLRTGDDELILVVTEITN